VNKVRIQSIIRLILCLFMLSATAPAQAQEAKPTPGDVPIIVEYLLKKDEKVRAGEKLIIRFRLLDKITNQPINDLNDARTLVFRAPGIWQKRDEARFIEKGIYEFQVTPPEPGVYMIFIEIKSRNLRFRDLPSHKFEVVAP
jgi:hypothetical protein